MIFAIWISMVQKQVFLVRKKTHQINKRTQTWTYLFSLSPHFVIYTLYHAIVFLLGCLSSPHLHPGVRPVQSTHPGCGGCTFQCIVDHFPWVVNEAFQWKRSCRPQVGWQLSRFIRTKIVPVWWLWCIVIGTNDSLRQLLRRPPPRRKK